MPIVTEAKLREAFSLALETRTPGYQDLVSNANAIWHAMKSKGMWKTFSGPTIRVRLLYAQSGTYTRYSYDGALNITRAELFSDAEYTARLAAVSVNLSNHEILETNGRNELKNRMMGHIEAGEQELIDRFVEDLHSNGGITDQIDGLQAAIPTDPTTGTYGGIDRASADAVSWRTSSFTPGTGPLAGVSAFDAASASTILRQVSIATSRHRKGPDMFAMSADHFNAYSEAVTAIQRITNDNGDGGLGFTSLKFYETGKAQDCILEGGIGTAMPDGVTYGIDSKGMSFRYHPQRNFQKTGEPEKPVDKDIQVCHIGFFGQLCMENPIHMSKIA